jgi:hypothetical protein
MLNRAAFVDLRVREDHAEAICIVGGNVADGGGDDRAVAVGERRI